MVGDGQWLEKHEGSTRCQVENHSRDQIVGTSHQSLAKGIRFRAQRSQFSILDDFTLFRAL